MWLGGCDYCLKIAENCVAATLVPYETYVEEFSQEIICHRRHL